MAIISGSRSPSPTSNPNSRPNSISRNSELNSPMRKSFSGNPFQRPSNSSRSLVPPTPANSPAEFYSGKEEKENEKDHYTPKPARARSPSVPRTSNHFMTPTISASSKINPSPKKKVLGERNEPLRASLSSLEGKTPFNSIENIQPNKEAVLETSFDHNNNNNPNSLSKISNIAPLDADPSLPPYDPKTNFLSPRPQFLHYRPNPRLELYFQENGKMNLDDSFLSESFSSETEVSSECSESESSLKESEDSEKDDPQVPKNEPISTDVYEESEVSKESEIKNSCKEFEDVSVVENIIDNSKIETEFEPINKDLTGNPRNESKDASTDGILIENSEKGSESSSIEVISKEDEPDVSEIEPITTPISDSEPINTPKETTSDEKNEAKSGYFTKTKLVSLFLVLLLACFSVSLIHSPISDTPIYNSLRSSKFYEEGFNEINTNMKLWSDYSASYFNELISSFNRVEKVGPLQFYNLTYTQENPFIDANIFEKNNKEENMFKDEDEFERLLDENIEREYDFDGERVISIIASDSPNGIDFDQNIEMVSFLASDSPNEIDFDQNIENAHWFDSEMFKSIASNSPNVNDFEEKSQVEALEFSPEEATSEVVVRENNGYFSEIAEIAEIKGYISETFKNGEIMDDASLISGNDNEPTKTEFNSENTLKIDAEIKGYISETFKNGEIMDDASLISGNDNEPTKTEFNSENTLKIDAEIKGYISETFKNGEIMDDASLISGNDNEPTKTEFNSENTLKIDASASDFIPGYKSSKQYKTLAVSLFSLTLIAASILAYLKNKNTKTHNSTVIIEPILENKTTKINTEADLVGESCPSEMSSFGGSISYSKRDKWGIINEAQSQDRKQKRVLKRESLASSSEFSDSPSYGSFTTYERLPVKHGYGDDEVVTPVRRSSRIKKIQVTSP